MSMSITMYLYLCCVLICLLITTTTAQLNNTIYTFTSTLPALTYTYTTTNLYTPNPILARQYANLSGTSVLQNVVTTEYNGNMTRTLYTSPATTTAVTYTLNTTTNAYTLTYPCMATTVTLYTQPDYTQTSDATSASYTISDAFTTSVDLLNVPYIAYTSPTFTCNTSLPTVTPNAQITCTTTTGAPPYTATISLLKTALTGTGSTVTVMLNTTKALDSTTIHNLQSLSLYQLQQAHFNLLTNTIISATASSRKSAAQVPVAIFWVFIILLLAIVAYIGAIWLHHLRHWPVPQFISNQWQPTEYVHVSHLTWYALSLALFVVVIAIAGLAGLVAVLCAYLLGSILCTIMYTVAQFSRGEYFKMIKTINNKQQPPATPLARQPGTPLTQTMNITMLLRQPSRISNNMFSGVNPNRLTNDTMVWPRTEPTVMRSDTSSLQPQQRPSTIDMTYTLDTPSDLPVKQYTQWPKPLTSHQGHMLIYALIGLFFMIICCFALIQIWQEQQYYLYDRVAQQPCSEFQPSTVSKATSLVYAFDSFANNALQVNKLIFPTATHVCGIMFNATLTTDVGKYNSIYQGYIVKYNIDMEQYNPQSYLEYSTVNQWFARHLAPGVRPIAAPLDNSVITSPTDSRLMVFPSISMTAQVWLKGAQLTPTQLLTDRGYSPKFEQGAMAIYRLAPQDYHRFHTPVSGVITDIYNINSGGYHSVNADAMTARDNALLNQRTVVMIDTTGYANIGLVAYVAVGALCISSVQLSVQLKSTIIKGDEIGYFQFGGSTVVTLYEYGAVTFDDDLVTASQAYSVETLVRMGTRMATVNSS